MAGGKPPENPSGREKVCVETQRSHAALLPNLFTVGNAICGFVALTWIANTQIEDGQILNPQNLRNAAWAILLGMACDVLDGRIARFTGATSELGAQLDSLADLVTFGLAPAAFVATLHRVGNWHPAWQQVAWVFGLAYFLGALLRLARFNVEHGPEEEQHLCFKGLPTPGAAGAVAGVVLVYSWLRDWSSWELRFFSPTRPDWVQPIVTLIPMLLPFLAFALGFAMVSSRLAYPHLASQMLGRRHSFDTFVTLVFGAILAVVLLEPIIFLTFFGYILWTPLVFGVRLLARRPTGTA